jgi:hypothetical protein
MLPHNLSLRFDNLAAISAEVKPISNIYVYVLYVFF